ncbi:MAG: hypothetical protein ACXW3C_14640 [Pyrinomonadaceae bacterium]
MNIRSAIPIFAFILIALSIGLPVTSVRAQKDKTVQPPAITLTRATSRHENHRLSYGGSVTIVGAPIGSIIIEGWSRSEVDVTAEIELRAGTTADLDLLAAVNNFAIDVDTNHIRILTTGTHDKKFMKSVAKKFPKPLIGLPWKIDFHIKVPAMVDLEIDSGVGPVKLAGVEGAIRLNALQSDADLTLTGGLFSAIIQRGAVNVRILGRSWRGLGANLQLAGGTLDVSLAPGFSGDIDATVLRVGEIKNSYPALEARERTPTTPRSLQGRAGAGGARLSFTVGDGRIEIKQVGGVQ